jgi:hypothetical protein
MMALSAALLAALVASAGAEPPSIPLHKVTALQWDVDRSSSPIVYETPFMRVRHRLRQVVEDDCDKEDRCFWRDSTGVLHYFWVAEGPRRLATKQVRAADFADRPVSALGIGRARAYADVHAAIRRFDRRLNTGFDPVRPTQAGPEECTFDLGPGWVAIWFTMNSTLDRIIFDASEFQ